MRRLLPLLLLALLVPAASAAARPSQITFFEAPRELRSDDTQLRTDTLDEIKALGVTHIRMNLFWRDVAPDAGSAVAPAIDPANPASYEFGQYDRVIGEALTRGLQPLITITGPGPKWATAAKRDQVTRPEPAQFRAFTEAVGRKYGQLVDFWSIWNEPNLPAYLRPQFAGGKVVSGKIYRGLYLAGRRGLKAAGEGSDPILIGETAPFGTSKTAAPLDFLRNVFGLKRNYRRAKGAKKLPVDGWAHHPYSSTAGPFFKPSDRDDVTIGTLGRLTKALDRAARAGVVRKRVPIWLNEFGVQSKPDPISGVSFVKQARYRSIAERIAYANPRVASFSQYLMRDDLRRGSSYGGFESGLRLAGGKAKLAYRDFKLPLTATRKGSSVKLWGLVRPANGRTKVTVEVRRGGKWKRVGTRRTNKYGVWKLKSGYTRGARFRQRWQDSVGIAVTPTR